MLFPLLVLATTPAEGAAAPPPVQEAVALVWGGGKDAAAAQEWRRRWDDEQKSVEVPLTLGQGFPKVLSSGSVSGMNPGFEVVILGFCKPDEGEPLRRFLKALYPFVYEKPVKVEALACPDWADGEARTVEAPSVLKARGATLTVAVASMEDKPSAPATTQLVRVVARDGKSQLLDAYTVDDDWNGSQNNGCETSVEVEAAQVVLERTCTHGVGAYCNRYPGQKSRIKVRWDGKELVAEEKTLSKWTIDIDKECAE